LLCLLRSFKKLRTGSKLVGVSMVASLSIL
jgi:hypothetical protein